MTFTFTGKKQLDVFAERFLQDAVFGDDVSDESGGGDVEAGSLVDERWLLDLERACFMELLATEKTQARIEHTLKTGKPLRN